MFKKTLLTLTAVSGNVSLSLRGEAGGLARDRYRTPGRRRAVARFSG